MSSTLAIIEKQPFITSNNQPMPAAQTFNSIQQYGGDVVDSLVMAILIDGVASIFKLTNPFSHIFLTTIASSTIRYSSSEQCNKILEDSELTHLTQSTMCGGIRTAFEFGIPFHKISGEKLIKSDVLSGLYSNFAYELADPVYNEFQNSEDKYNLNNDSAGAGKQIFKAVMLDISIESGQSLVEAFFAYYFHGKNFKASFEASKIQVILLNALYVAVASEFIYPALKDSLKDVLFSTLGYVYNSNVYNSNVKTPASNQDFFEQNVLKMTEYNKDQSTACGLEQINYTNKTIYDYLPQTQLIENDLAVGLTLLS